MQIINFTEQLIKPALQDRSKCHTIRPAWTVISSEDGICREFTWFEQSECRHTVGELRQLYWKQRSQKKECGNNCVFRQGMICTRVDHETIIPFHPENRVFPCFSKVFGVGKILQTQKIFMDTVKEEDDTLSLVVRNIAKDPLEIITEQGTFFKSTASSISMEDGFKNPVDFKNFFLNTYPILLRERLPFWWIGWGWQL